MARPRKSKANGTEATKAEASPEVHGNIGHNSTGLTDDQSYKLLLMHKDKYERALAVKKKADADLKNVCKLAKADLGSGAVDDIKQAIELTTPEGETAFRERMERIARVARWSGLPIGHSDDLFQASDDMPATDKAAQAGKRDGLAGVAAAPAYAAETPQFRAYMKAYHEGQAVILDGIKGLSINGAAGAAEDEGELSEHDADELEQQGYSA